MTTAVTVDHDLIHDSFCQWQADQEQLDAQVAESVAALEAYQSHLDAWQRELAEERDTLRRLREDVEHDQAFAGPPGEQLEELQRELNEARKKVTSLTTALLTRTEELRELDRLRVQTDHQLVEARAREKELLTTLEVERRRFQVNGPQVSEQPGQLREPIQRGAKTGVNGKAATNGHAANGPPAAARPQSESNKSSNAVLGSVMEQFGKLRQQRSAGRQNNPKPR